MSIQTSTGVKIYISTQLPATFDLAGYGVLTWTEIKEVTNIVPPSPSYQVVTHEPLKTGIKQKNKGFVDYGDPTIDYALDTSDTGQQMLQSAASGATKNLEHSFKLTYPNGDIRYFSGRVFSSLEGGFSANSMVSGTSNVGVSRAIVKIPAISFAANYITNTYSILGESKTFADAHTFTRSTTATFVGSNGLIQSAAIDAPRFTYDPVTLAPKGLLIEGSRTNLLTYSEQFDNAVWGKENCTVAVNNTTSPDGSATADKVVTDNISSTSIRVLRAGVVTVGQKSFSFFAKAAGKSFCGFEVFNATQNVIASGYFNLSTGDTNLISGDSISAEAHGSGWFRCSFETSAATENSTVFIYITDSISARTCVGDGTSGIYIWGAQLEAGSFASSYIPTTTAQVTRTADICTAKEFASWYNQSEGSVYCDFKVERNPNLNAHAVAIGNATNRHLILINSSNNIEIVNTVSSSTVATSVVSNSSGVSNMVATQLKPSGSDVAVNGVFYDKNMSAPQSVVSNFRFGADTTGANHLYGTIAQLNYYPTALSDEALQDLTR